MLKTFSKGLAFGVGFAIALVAVFAIVSLFDFSQSVESNTVRSMEGINRWNELTINEKIDRSSAVALVRFKSEPEGLNAAYIDSIVTKDSSVKLDIDSGDRLEELDFYSSGHGNDRNGELLFFVGSTGQRRDRAFLYDDRLIAAGDMPLEIFLRKFDEAMRGELDVQASTDHKSIEDIDEFHELTLEQKIQQSSAILLTEYSRNNAGKAKNIVVEILKKDSDVELFYTVGDEYQLYGDLKLQDDSAVGYVVFMGGNPARMRYAVTYQQGRVGGLGNVSLSTLREKCET